MRAIMGIQEIARYEEISCSCLQSMVSSLISVSIRIHLFGNIRSSCPLRDGMLRSEHEVELRGLPQNIGWWTQRIDVHMRDLPDAHMPDLPDKPGLILDALADILRRLPNLRVLTFAITGYRLHHYYDILQAASACCDTLRFLNWYGGLRPPSHTWASFLKNHPRLEAINAPVNLHKFGNSHIVLNSVKSVYVHCHRDPPASRVQNGLWNIEFPNIRHAIYDITLLTSESIPHNDFLQKIGPNLTSIQVNFLQHAIPSAFDRIFGRIVVACKKLTRVDIVNCEWRMPTFILFPKTIHTLGIRVIAIQILGSADPFFRTMQDFFSGFPSLKTICFMDQENIQALRQYPQAFSSNLDRIIMLGIDVVDHEGHSLVTPSERTVPSKLFLVVFDLREFDRWPTYHGMMLEHVALLMICNGTPTLVICARFLYYTMKEYVFQ